jgi:endonuclease YncB( thermonuclease family)
VTGGVAPGWYPDYEAPPGHQRYWNGERWTERRSGTPEEPPARAEGQVRRLAPWVLSAVAVLVFVSAAVLVVGDDQTASSSNGSSPPAASSTPDPPARAQTGPDDETQPDDETEPGRRTWQVDAAIDGSTLRLSNGAEVRLVGIADSCGADLLATMVVGHQVMLTRRGPDKDGEGRLLRYVERGGADVGKRLIQRGRAKASDEPNPRRGIYRRIDERSPDRC